MSDIEAPEVGSTKTPTQPEPSRLPVSADRLLVWTVCATSAVGAGLLFMVEPMIAKLVLPLFGGVPSVWNTAIFFFQASLLAGYLLTHLTIRRLGVRRQMGVQAALVLLPLAVLPLALPASSSPPAGVPAELWLLYVLVVSVGAPFVVLSTAGPLLQRWFGATRHCRAADPYFLFAAGNVGSLLALCAYPTLVEPHISLHDQLRLWSAGYLLFVVLIFGCVVLVRRTMAAHPSPEPEPTQAAPRLRRSRRLRWVVLAFLPSSMMLGTTTFVTTNIAPIPLLWVLPLSLYLVTFIVAFALPREAAAVLSRRLSAIVPALAIGAGLNVAYLIAFPTVYAIFIHLAIFTAIALTAHCALAADRPPVSQLTAYYLLVALGGVLGGAFNGLIAPVAFNGLYEYPLIIAAAVMLHRASPEPGWLRRRLPPVRASIAWLVAAASPFALALAAHAVPGQGKLLVAVATFAAVGAIALVTARRMPAAFAAGLAVVLVGIGVQGHHLLLDRSFFGVQRVDALDGRWHILTHGNTVHGIQDLRAGHRLEPLSYYHRQGPAGDVFDRYAAAAQPSHVAVIGLGAGSLAAYGRPGQRFTFYELDPVILTIARDPRLFTYLHDSAARVDVVVGDGRLRIAQAAPQTYDLIVVDAFSSDAIPVHLLTAEAIDLYAARLRPGGWLAFHVTNRHLELSPVLANVARSRGLFGAIRVDNRGEPAVGKAGSTWVVLSPDRSGLASLLAAPEWHDLAARRTQAPPWTDDFSNIFGVLRWRS